MKLAFKIASRFLRDNPGQSILIILGIAIGVSVQVFIGLLIQSLQTDLVDTTIGNSSQITITAEEGAIDNWEEVVQMAEETDDRLESVNAVVDGSAFLIEKNEEESSAVVLRGFDFEKAEGIYGFEEKITEGTLPGEGEIALGKDLLAASGYEIGDTAAVTTPDGTFEEYEISGSFDFKVTSINDSWILLNRREAMAFFAYENEVTSIEMQVSDVFASDLIAEEIQNNLGNDDLAITDWKAENEQLLGGLNGQSISSVMIQVFVMVSVVLGIASVLAITVMQKSRQIGILKAMGIKDGSASLVFLFQGFLLGIFGALVGVGLGLGLTFAFSTFALNPDGTPIIPIYVNYGFIALSAGIAIAASLAASFIPARKSLKLDPVEVIRNG
ncbi:MAG TPA: ABC transporter permease [Eubacteriaceae bacterium]|nr:ABC transporter permease [Eubacteriaceae bacterium]